MSRNTESRDRGQDAHPAPNRPRRWSGPASNRRVAAIALLTVLVAAGGAAFTLLGISWPSRQVSMRTGGLNSGGSCGGNCQSLALSAMNSWNASCNPDPDFTWSRSTQNCTSCTTFDGINCTDWENLGQCSTGTVTLGVTYLWVFTGSNRLAGADVSMNSSCSFNPSTFLGVLSHEDGHVMGLGHSQFSGALMAAFYTGTNSPQADDCNGARAIYPPQVQNFTLTVSKTGTGTVTSSPSGINCGGTCSASYPSGQQVTLTATPAAGWQFSSWSGNSDCSDGQVTMNANKSCTANFTQLSYTLSVSKVGSGTVTSSPSGINCGPTCSTSYLSFTQVTLTATPAAGWTFTGWSGLSDCSDGKVTMSGSRSCTANFKRLWTLTVTKSGTGFGTVTSYPPGINCGGDCDEEYLEGTEVTLKAFPAFGSELTAWSGAADCDDAQVTMSAAMTCNAVFNTCSAQPEVTLQEAEVSATETYVACNNVHLGPNVHVTGTGNLIVHAGNRVTFYDGFVLDDGGRLEAVVGQPMPPP